MNKKRTGASGAARAERVGDEIRDLIAKLIVERMADPRVQRCTITKVKLSPDLRYGKVYFSLVDADEGNIKETRRALSKAEGFFKKHIGENIRLRFMPELTFFYDDSMAYGQYINELMHRHGIGGERSMAEAEADEDVDDTDLEVETDDEEDQ